MRVGCSVKQPKQRRDPFRGGAERRTRPPAFQPTWFSKPARAHARFILHNARFCPFEGSVRTEPKATTPLAQAEGFEPPRTALETVMLPITSSPYFWRSSRLDCHTAPGCVGWSPAEPTCGSAYFTCGSFQRALSFSVRCPALSHIARCDLASGAVGRTRTGDNGGTTHSSNHLSYNSL